MPEQDAAARSRNFDEVALGYTEQMALDEASRCLHCKNSPCISGCPVFVHIPEFIHALLDHNFEEAYDIITSQRPAPICGRSVRRKTNARQSACAALRGSQWRSAASSALWRTGIWRKNRKHRPLSHLKPNGHCVAVVGSGPAGSPAPAASAGWIYDHGVEAFHTRGRRPGLRNSLLPLSRNRSWSGRSAT